MSDGAPTSVASARARPAWPAGSCEVAQRRLRGYVKSYCPFKGAGFIKCEGLQLGFTRDVFIDRVAAEKSGLTTGATVTFVLTHDNDSRPRAEDIRVLIQGHAMKERVSKLIGTDIDWRTVYVGIIRTLWRGGEDSFFSPPSMQRKDRGGAFILSEEAHKVFKLDIWAYPSKLGDLKVGDVVKFKVEIDSRWSYPCAYDVSAEDAALQDAVRANTSAARSASAHQTVALPEQLLRTDAPTEEVNLPSSGPAQLQSVTDASAADETCPPAAAAESVECAGTFLLSIPTPCRNVHEAESLGVLHSESCGASAKMGERKWQKFKVENGSGYWWWCEKDSDWFLEEQPGRWVQYVDTDTANKYWWRDDESWFWG